MDVAQVLLAVAVALITWGLGIFYHGKKIGGLENDLRQEKRKTFDHDIGDIRNRHTNAPIDILLDDDEYIDECDKKQD